jgi:phosphate transport system substrate-binding protein
MHALRSTRAVALCLVVLLPAATAAAAETLHMGGTGSALGLLRQVGAEFTAATEVKIDVVPALGSSGAARALIDGKLDLAVSARPLKAEDAAAGLIQVAVLRTAFVFATSHRKPNGLKSGELARIYAGDQMWADSTPIRPILRPRSEADNALLGVLISGMDAAIEATRRRPDVPIAATDQDNVALAERTPGSLIATTSAQLVTERPDLKTVPIDDVAPSLANFESGAYRFTKKMYVFIRSNGSPESHRFVAFLRSPQGVRMLRAAETLLDPE